MGDPMSMDMSKLNKNIVNDVIAFHDWDNEESGERAARYFLLASPIDVLLDYLNYNGILGYDTDIKNILSSGIHKGE